MNPVTNTLFTFQMQGSSMNCCGNCSGWSCCGKSSTKEQAPNEPTATTEEEQVASLPPGKSFRLDPEKQKLFPVDKASPRSQKHRELDRRAWDAASEHLSSRFKELSKSEVRDYCETLKVYGDDHMLDKKSYLHLVRWAVRESGNRVRSSSESVTQDYK